MKYMKQAKQSEIKEEIERIHDVAEKRGYYVNPNTKQLYSIASCLVNNKKKYNTRFCPCKPQLMHQTKIINGVKRYVSECPCIDLKNEIAQNQRCCCNLYFSR